VTNCLFVSDLHGRTERYRKLFAAIVRERPAVVFLGGDLLPSGMVLSETVDAAHADFALDFLAAGLLDVRHELAAAYPRVLLIPGNDDPKAEEPALYTGEERGAWECVQLKKVTVGAFAVYGYAFVPPTPFLLKDWERYDVSRYVDPGCIAPDEGYHTVPVSEHDVHYGTIQHDLAALTGEDALDSAVLLCHAPPYNTQLDRAALDGKMIDHAPLDVHVGSIALRRCIEARQPLLTLHGHIHESARLTGAWRDTLGRTVCLSAAHDGPELALVRFDLEAPAAATRELL
jgi:uncharacterized protein